MKIFRNLFIPSNPSTFFLLSPLPGRWPVRFKVPHSPARRASAACPLLTSSGPLPTAPRARAAPLPAYEAETMGAARAAPGGRWQESTASFHGRSTAPPGLWAEQGSPRRPGAGAGDPSRNLCPAPLRRSMWRGDGIHCETSLSAGRHGHDGRALRGGSPRLLRESQARGAGIEVGGQRIRRSPLPGSSPRKEGVNAKWWGGGSGGSAGGAWNGGGVAWGSGWGGGQGSEPEVPTQEGWFCPPCWTAASRVWAKDDELGSRMGRADSGHGKRSVTQVGRVRFCPVGSPRNSLAPATHPSDWDHWVFLVVE